MGEKEYACVRCVKLRCVTVARVAVFVTGPVRAFGLCAVALCFGCVPVCFVRWLCACLLVHWLCACLLCALAVYGGKFTLHTDHQALKYLMTQKELNGRQARWLDFLADYDIDIDYVKGKTHTVADALSRPVLNLITYSVRSNEFGENFIDFVGEYNDDSEFAHVKNGSKDHQGFRNRDGVLFLQDRVWVPRKYRTRVMELHHDVPVTQIVVAKGLK